MTYQELIESALRRIRVKSEGETATTSEITDGLESLNALINSLQTERLNVYTSTRTTFTIVASTTSYSVGSGGDINIARPIWIDNVGVVDANSQETPLSKLTEDQYATWVDKTLTTSGEPTYYYYNPTFATGTLYLLPITTDSTLTGVLYVPTVITEVSAASDTVSLPPGYRRMLITSLALEMAPEYGVEVDPVLLREQSQAMGNVKRANFRFHDMSVDPMWLGSGGGHYNILADR